jgi:hypothetical protein
MQISCISPDWRGSRSAAIESAASALVAATAEAIAARAIDLRSLVEASARVEVTRRRKFFAALANFFLHRN